MIEEILDKAMTCVQNELKFAREVNGLRRKLVLAIQCLNLQADLNRSLEHEANGALSSEGSRRLEALVSCLKMHLHSCKSLEESNEYKYVKAEI